MNRLLREYNLSLLDINDRQPEEKFQIRTSDRFSFKDTFGSYWKRDLLHVLCQYNYCRLLIYQGTTDMIIVGTEENITAVSILYDYLCSAFRRLANKRHLEYVSSKRGYYRTGKYKKKYIRSYLEGVSPGLREQFEAMYNLSVETVRDTALVLCQGALIDKFLEKIRICKKVLTRNTQTDYSAYYSGMGDGRSISLNRQIEGGCI